MENKAYQYWSGLPSWAKGIVAVGGIAIGYFGIRSFINKIKEDAAKKNQVKTQTEQKDELEQNIQNGIKPTFATSQYNQWADELQAQFDGCDFQLHIPNVDPRIIFNNNWSGSGQKLANIIIQFKNDSDFLALSTSWGASRTYDQCGWGTGNFEGNLSQAVTDELDQSEIQAINEYLATQKITYRF